MILVPATNQRYQLMDVSRGVAILGILWLNIFIFGMPFDALVIPGIWGEANAANIAVWDFVSIGVAGVMRGMISMLFGAAALLMLQRAERDLENIESIDRFFRRLLWLILFGVVHSYILLWPHDILFVYGVLGLLIFPFRNLSIKRLMGMACVMLCFSIFFTAQNSNEIEAAQSAVEKNLTEDEIDKLRKEEPLIENYDDSSLNRSPFSNPSLLHLASDVTEVEEDVDKAFNEMLERISESIVLRQQGYQANFRSFANETFDEQTDEMLTNHLWDVATFFLFGMVLLKSGFLTGQWQTARYAKVAIIGYFAGISLGLITYSTFDEGDLLEPLSTAISDYTYDLRRLSLSLANFGLLAVLLQLNFLRIFTNALASCGRMAFSLYISQTIMCNLLFLGFGLSLYGALEHFEIALVAMFLTIAQLVFATVYFKFFPQGPLEWLLRSLVNFGQVRQNLAPR